MSLGLGNNNNNTKEKMKNNSYKIEPVWRNIIFFALLHISALYGLYLTFTSAKITTTIFTYFMHIFGGFGITGGAHRLWAHKSFKVNTPLKIFFVICNTIAFQDSVIDWARDHRLHHKYSDTNADPYNATRGFFFSHIGWLLCRKHPDVKQTGKQLDMSDLTSEPILRFQKRHYMILMPLCCFVVPTVIPVYFWGETWKNSFFANLLRYCYTLNTTWLVNSAAHMFGMKPYDKSIKPSENFLVAFLTWGEGWHNYHHVFPYDYRAAELGGFSFNFTRVLIDVFDFFGWAYDLKHVTKAVVEGRVSRTGDGSHNTRTD